MKEEPLSAARLEPRMVIREEFDDYAILYDPDTTRAYVINPVAVRICRKLDGVWTPAQIAASLTDEFTGVSETVEEDIKRFINSLIELNLATGPKFDVALESVPAKGKTCGREGKK